METKYIRFGELYAIPSSNGVSRPSSVRGKGFRMINMGELFAYDIINDMDMELVELSTREQEKYFVRKGDLLFARQSLVASGAGKCSIVNNISQNTTFESHLIRVRLDIAKSNPWYYYYLFKLPSNPIKSIVNQCAQAGIRGTELSKVKVPLPSLPLQRRIASILSAYDNLIEANSRRIKILEQMAENLYKEWFVRFRFPNYQNTPIENGIPKGWKVEKLKKITKRLPFNRLYKASDLEPEGDVIVIDQSTSAYLGFHNNEPSHYANIDDPIIIFGDHSCKFQLMIQNFSLGENVIPFISNDFNTIDNYFFYYATHKLIETEEYKRHWGRLMAMKILIPSINIQRAFSQIVKPIHSEIATLQTQSANLTRQRDLLLPRLMSGQLPTQ